MIATQGHPEGEAGSSLAGLDYQFLSTTVAGDRTLQAYAWAQQSRNAGLGTGQAQGARIAWPNDGLWAKAGWWRADDRFEPALGFLQERGVEHLDGELGWRERRADGSILLPLLYAGVRRRLRRQAAAGRHPNVGQELALDKGPQLAVQLRQAGRRRAHQHTRALVAGLAQQPAGEAQLVVNAGVKLDLDRHALCSVFSPRRVPAGSASAAAPGARCRPWPRLTSTPCRRCRGAPRGRPWCSAAGTWPR